MTISLSLPHRFPFCISLHTEQRSANEIGFRIPSGAPRSKLFRGNHIKLRRHFRETFRIHDPNAGGNTVRWNDRKSL